MTMSKIYLSWSFRSSVEKFNLIIQNSEDQLEIIEYNIVCVILTISFVESYINEIINSANDWDSIKFNSEFISNLNEREKSLSIVDKYNNIAIKLGMPEWTLDTEPYTSLKIITDLRNDIIHYKGSFIDTNKSVSKSTTHLMKILKISRLKNSHWINDLFASKKLSQLCFKTLKEIDLLFTNLVTNFNKH